MRAIDGTRWSRSGLRATRISALLGLLATLLVAPPLTAPAAAAAPTVASISPSSGSVSGGTTVTITGSDLTGVTDVTFDGVSGTSLTVVDDTELTVATPPSAGLAVGSASVVVTNPDGSTDGSDSFGYRPELQAVDDVQVALDDLASRSQRKPIVRTSSAPYLVVGTDSLTGDSYTYETDTFYNTSEEAYNYESDQRNSSVSTSFQTDYDVTGVSGIDDRTDVLRLGSSGGCDSGNTFDGKTTYCAAFGPQVYTEPFFAESTQALAFDWAASNNSDDYEIYAYLVAVPDPNVDTSIPTATSAHTLIAHGVGNVKNWTTATGDIPANGYYRFRFVNGTYDGTGGFAIGSDMYIDDVILVGLKNEISFPSIGDKIGAGGGTFDVTVTATSGEPVTIISADTGVCDVSVSGSTATITKNGFGTCTLRASQGATGDYAPAATVTRFFEIRETAVVPEAPTLTTLTPEAESLTVGFLPPGSDGGAAITNYEYSLDGGSTWTALDPADAESPVEIPGLDPEQEYTVTLRAVNSVGAGPASNSLTATTKALQSALVVQGDDFTYGDTTELSTSGGDGTGTVTYSVQDGPCSVSGTTLSATAAGTCTVTATKAGDETYGETTSAPVDIDVAPRTLTVVGATVTTKVADGTTDAVITGASLSGLVGDDVVTLDNATTGTFADAGPGSDIAVSTAMALSGPDAGNYTLTQPSLTGTIAPPPTVEIVDEDGDDGAASEDPAPGDTIQLEVCELQPGSQVTVVDDDTDQQLGQATAGEDGCATVQVTVPEEPEDDVLQLRIEGTDRAGQPSTLVLTVALSDVELPAAGIGSNVLAPLALALLLAGALALVVSRRPRRPGTRAG